MSPKEPILQAMYKILDNQTKHLKLLEIASGNGTNLAYIANAFRNITFQPSEYDRSMFCSIANATKEYSLDNVDPPVYVDISTRHTEWEPRLLFDPNTYDYMLNINMLHISPWDCAEGLFKNAAILLKRKGLLITYGAYAIDGILEPESNVSFDAMLKSQNSDWGVRDIKDLNSLAEKSGLIYRGSTDMPKNNKILIWQKE